MTIEELNKIIQEELKAYLNEEQTDEAYMEDGDEDAPEADGDDDIEVTTDEPDADTGEEAMDLLRQIYDMIKPQVEPEAEEEPEMDMDMGAEEPPAPAADEPAGEEEDEKEIMELALEGVDYIPSKEEVVNEVAKRVARRIKEAKEAQTRLNRALGK